MERCWDDEVAALPVGSTRSQFVELGMSWLPENPTREQIANVMAAIASAWADRRVEVAEKIRSGTYEQT